MTGKSESEKERKCKRSACWYFYDKTDGGGFCRICQREILTQAGGTTNLRNHLRRRHGELWTACMENRLDPDKLRINRQRSANDGDGVAADEDAGDTAAEANSAVHTLQAYRDVNGTTFLYLHPAAEGETAVQVQSAHFQPVVASSESITANGEIVSVAVQKEASVLEDQVVDGEAKTPEEAGTRRLVHVPVKNHQGSTLGSRAVVRQVNRPNPIKTTPSANANNNNSDSNSHKEDCFDAFGKYIASMLRNLNSKTACKLQGEIVNWILKEQMKSNDS